MPKYKIDIFFNIFFLLINLSLFFSVLLEYEANKIIYTLFALTNYLLVFFSFNKKTIFFEKILSIFLWLGFSFKFAMPYFLEHFNYHIDPFPEIRQSYDFKLPNKIYDEALIFSIVAFSGLLLASFFRKKYIFNYEVNHCFTKNSTSDFYYKYRILILWIFVSAFLILNISNLYFEIYQKGLVSIFSSKIIINLYKWSLLMGLSSFACMFIYFDIQSNKNYMKSSYLFLMEGFFSNTSVLSRSFIFNATILILIFLKKIKNKIKIKTWFFLILTIVILFYVNILLSTQLRECAKNYNSYSVEENIFISKRCLNIKNVSKEYNLEKEYQYTADINSSNIVNKIFTLFVKRWVGIDSLMAVIYNKDKLNFDLYYSFLKEKTSKTNVSNYEILFLKMNKSEVIESYARDKEKLIKFNQIILPGFVAYQSIAGSKLFLFLSCLILGLIGGFLERQCYKFSFNNYVLSSFISYIAVFRIIHFGYLPLNSILYFCIIVFTFLQFKIYELILSKIKDILGKNNE